MVPARLLELILLLLGNDLSIRLLLNVPEHAIIAGLEAGVDGPHLEVSLDHLDSLVLEVEPSRSIHGLAIMGELLVLD